MCSSDLHIANGDASKVLAILGGRDPYTPSPDIEKLRATGATCVVYPEAEHAFAHDPSRPVHRPDDAADAYARAKQWLLGALD